MSVGLDLVVAFGFEQTPNRVGFFTARQRLVPVLGQELVREVLRRLPPAGSRTIQVISCAFSLPRLDGMAPSGAAQRPLQNISYTTVGVFIQT